MQLRHSRLEGKGVHVNQVILRGSFISQLILSNVDRVDYIAAEPPWSDRYYSVDINPFDSVSVNEHVANGLYGHMPADDAREETWTRIGDMVIDLIAAEEPQ